MDNNISKQQASIVALILWYCQTSVSAIALFLRKLLQKVRKTSAAHPQSSEQPTDSADNAEDVVSAEEVLTLPALDEIAERMKLVRLFGTKPFFWLGDNYKGLLWEYNNPVQSTAAQYRVKCTNATSAQLLEQHLDLHNSNAYGLLIAMYQEIYQYLENIFQTHRLQIAERADLYLQKRNSSRLQTNDEPLTAADFLYAELKENPAAAQRVAFGVESISKLSMKFYEFISIDATKDILKISKWMDLFIATLQHIYADGAKQQIFLAELYDIFTANAALTTHLPSAVDFEENLARLKLQANEQHEYHSLQKEYLAPFKAMEEADKIMRESEEAEMIAQLADDYLGLPELNTQCWDPDCTWVPPTSKTPRVTSCYRSKCSGR